MSPIPGVNVVEKGTRNGTATSIDGTFTLSVLSPNSILIFSFVGYVTQEVKLRGQTKIKITLRTDCNRDWFDNQRVGIYANSGIINNPIGGQIELSFPAFYRQTTLKSGLSYQSNLDENQFVNAQIGLHHLAVSCKFDADINWYYRKISWDNELNSKAYSIETNLNFSSLRFILGYSAIDLTKIEKIDSHSDSGPLIGIGTWLGGPFDLLILGKISIYKDLVEYHGEVNRRFKKVNTFIKFYKVDSFTELSLGIGTEIKYKFNRQRM
jgi:CarboxypepD_reg-like domain